MSLVFLTAFGQKVKVIDAITQEQLVGVVVVNQDNKRYSGTDEKGEFDLSVFLDTDRIRFQMIGYENLSLSPAQIIKRGKIIGLSSDENKLNEIVLSVARTAEQSEKIAEKVALINKIDIKEQAPTTGADLLLLAPGVRLQKSQGGGGSPVLRGFEANRVLLVVDGVRMNNAIYRSGHLQNAITIDPQSIERVEVLFGPSSVGYGSDAMGGVVHYYTKTPKINNSKRLTPRFSSNFQSASQAQNYHFEIEASFSKWASYSSVSFSKFGDLRMGKNRQHGYEKWGLVEEYSANTETYFYPKPSTNEDPNIQKNIGYEQLDFLQKFIINLPQEKQLTINTQFSTSSNIPRFDKLNEMRDGSLRFAEWYYGPQKRFLFSPQFKIYPKKKGLYKGTLTAAYQNISESRIKRLFGEFFREEQNENLDVFSLNGDFQMIKKEKSSFAYGFELIGNKVKSNAFSKRIIFVGNKIISLGNTMHIPTRYPSGGSSYYVAALYGNYRLDINPKVTLAVGSRFTSTLLKANWTEQALIDSSLDRVNVRNDALTGSIAWSYRPTDEWKINLLVSNGFRAPNVDDLGKIRENKGVLIVPNTDLKPEYVYNLDGGIAYQSNSGNSSFSLRGYHSYLRDYIGRQAYSIMSDQTTLNPETILFSREAVQTIANTNIGRARIYGASFIGSLSISPSINLYSDISYTRAPKNETIGPLPSILPFFGNFRLSYFGENFSLSLRNTFSSGKNPEDYSNGGEDGIEETPIVFENENQINYAGTPRWSILSLHSFFDFSENVQGRLAIENLFDLHYREFASGISSPGRSLNVGFVVGF